MSGGLLLLVVRAAEPLPTPTTPEDLDPLSVSPGLIGFLATFAVVVATVLLILDMVRRLRRIRFREEQARREAEEFERAAAEQDDPPPPLTP